MTDAGRRAGATEPLGWAAYGVGCSGGAVGGGRSSSGSRPVGAVGGGGSGAGGAGASRVMPSNQSRAGWNHSITIAAVTIAGTTLAPGSPTKKKLARKSGTASTDSASRAPLERCSAYQPRTAVAAADDRGDGPDDPQQRQHALHAEPQLVTGRAGEVLLDRLAGVERVQHGPLAERDQHDDHRPAHDQPPGHRGLGRAHGSSARSWHQSDGLP